MKKHFSHFFIACIFTSAICHLTSYISHSQTFSLTNIDTIKYAGPGSPLYCKDSLINNSSTGYYVDVVRVQNDTAPNWQTYFCLDVCYLPSVDSARVYLLPDSSQVFILDFLSDSLPDSSTVLMKFVNTINPSNVVYQRFYGISVAGMSVNSVSKEAGVEIFPSPVATNSTFCFRIADKKNKSENYSLVLYDVCGKSATHIENLMNGDNYLSLNLNEGIYFYALVKGKESIKTGKIAVAR